MRMGARVLVVDDDPWILRMVTASLEKRSYVVDTAKEGRQALVRAEAHPPDVIISDLMMPVMDGWTFVRELRQNPRLSRVPIIFLTALGQDEARIGQLGELGIGPDDYLPKPFRFEDLQRRVSRALARSEPSSRGAIPETQPAPPVPAASSPPAPAVAPPPYPYPYPAAQGAYGYPPSYPYPYPSPTAYAYPPRPEPNRPPSPPSRPPKRATALNGRLEQLQLSSLLVMMEMERKAGVLTLKGTTHGRIFLRGGQVICAKLDDRPELSGRECVYEMLRWDQGTFSFNAMEVDMEDTVNSTTTHLLMEGARLIDESNREVEGPDA